MLPHDSDWPLPASVPSLAHLLARGAPRDAEDIEKDLHRVGRKQLGVEDADAEAYQDSLRQVLHAWCWCSRGYAQSMSHVAASLVAAAPNVDGAFCSFAWLMLSLPSNFFDDGHRVEVRALRILAAQRWPDVMEPAVYETFELVTTQWLLSLWAGILPQPCCLAIWALMTTDEHFPSDISLRVGLVLLANALMDIHDAVLSDTLEQEGACIAYSEDEPSVCCAAYSALQQAAQWHGDSDSLVAASRALHLPSHSVHEARTTASIQLDAETGARERATAEARARAKRHEEQQKAQARAFGPLPAWAEGAALTTWPSTTADPVLEGRLQLEEFDRPPQQAIPFGARPYQRSGHSNEIAPHSSSPKLFHETDVPPEPNTLALQRLGAVGTALSNPALDLQYAPSSCSHAAGACDVEL
ncbi:hypothetical protein AB1Y20_017743 [Prymnesium parvum]|uniref:Rab-GAP TBC domain-containing protein n=1 Tax=Prymnesium parvum TaxID=97485 RepID=A0AB34JLI1_PRYPA|mmetsp:Transcript_6144/g.15592  ORF Transcript_6144/g.15592 Transcript_6144/m.15592 type:complete len:414 (+) Transcript_6144:50-1291(+)